MKKICGNLYEKESVGVLSFSFYTEYITNSRRKGACSLAHVRHRITDKRRADRKKGVMRMRTRNMMTPILAAALGLTIAFAAPAAYGWSQTALAAEEEQQPITVSMSAGSGIYAEAFTLTLTSEGAKTIYYTLDGSDPKTSSTRAEYTDGITIKDRSKEANYVSAVDPLLFDNANVRWKKRTKSYTTTRKAPADTDVDKGTVVKAVAVDANGNFGTVETNTYFVGTVAMHIKNAQKSAQAAGIPLSVMSISMNYEDLFDYEKGIYVKGKIFDEAVAKYLEENPKATTDMMNDQARRLPANYNQKGKDWERNAHIDYFVTDGTTLDCQLQQDCGIRIQGNYSRSDLMKGLRLYARADYGKKNFKYPFFENAKDDSGKTITKHKKLVLRNGGNYAFAGTKYNDAYWQSMLSDLDCETQGSRACVVYIDGEYWGLYILQQDFDDSYFEETHGVNKDSVVVYKASDADADEEYGYKLDEGTLPDGETDVNYFYRDLMNFFAEHKNLKNDADYEAFCKLVDPQSVMDFFAAQVWINNKWDWPGKNWSMWRTTTVDPNNAYADGRFRFCLYDLDFGGCGGSGEAYANTIRDDNYNTNVDAEGNYYNDRGLLGQNLKEAMNPSIQCFIMLMSNEKFRNAYKQELLDLSKKNFESSKATTVLTQFKNTYEPLFAQYYTRYNWSNDTTNGYAGYNSLKSFVEQRPNGIAQMNTWIDNFYKTGKDEEVIVIPSPSPSVTPSTEPSVKPSASPSSKPTPAPTVSPTKKPVPNPGQTKKTAKTKKIKKLGVKAKKKTKVIRVSTVGKAQVTIVVSKKIIVKGKKKVKKITKKTSAKGVVSFKLSKKLTKGTKITVTVHKKGYKTKKKSIKIK